MITTSFYQQLQDSIIPVSQDTAKIRTVSQGVNSGNPDSINAFFPPPRVSKTTQMKQPVKNDISSQQADTLLKKHKPVDTWNSSDNFLVNNGLTGIVGGLTSSKHERLTMTVPSEKSLNIPPEIRNKLTYDWLLGLFILLTVLFVWIRIFYSKFFGMLGNALVSFHLSLKLFEEKNVLLHRVSIVLDFIYIIVFSIFIFEFIEYFGFSATKMRGINLFLLLFNIMVLYIIFRIFTLRITGSLFMAKTLFSEYIHNTFVVNKVLGIVMFPMVIMAMYLPHKLIPVIFVLGGLAFLTAFLLKTFRAYQIIIRKDILLFYLILYLCTLEILPLLLGYKFVTALIQSN